MASSLLFGFCVLSLTLAASGLHSSDQPLMFASLGDSVTLPCGVPSITSRSSVSWTWPETVTEVVKAGQVTELYVPRFNLLQDYSLQIHHVELNDAQLYSCESGGLSSRVSLHVLQIDKENTPSADMLELHCYLNTHKGHVSCNNRGINTTWITEDNKPLNGGRFTFEYVSECFSKLIIHKKLTDHYRKWRCQLNQNQTVKARASYTTTVKGTEHHPEQVSNRIYSLCVQSVTSFVFTLDGQEEVFAVVSESVSLTCGNTSSLSVGSRVEWGMSSHTLVGDRSPDKKQIEASHINKDFSLDISRVNPLHAGGYQCSESAGHQVLNKIKLHTLDVTSESSSGGGNLTLTCVLTCSEECEKDFNLAWSGSGPNCTQSTLMHINNTLMKSLLVTSLSMVSDELICSVHREGELMASKRWFTVNTLQTPAWLAFPLGLLLVFMSAGGLYMYIKRKHNKDAGTGNERSSIGMTHIYEGIEDHSYAEQHQQRNTNIEAATTTDSFYDLLQAVN
ncbi:uncharacterized protein LOC117822273 isoform X3 [Notolabrus celidotus]|uniref:uncharacterized protein LOC117822273 isoform X3 n=1 Tax=Notolabrus celidotus TaxID=1203425 RepID=UPI00148FDE4D|nr:uncharacterized protein LOC117822273 isoform X3 [Notolabrus celidotus]